MTTAAGRAARASCVRPKSNAFGTLACALACVAWALVGCDDPVPSADAGAGAPNDSATADAPSGTEALSTTMTRIDFGTVVIGDTSPPHEVTITNTGAFDLPDIAPRLAGLNPSDFAISASTCTGTTLVVGASCSVTLTFQPVADRSASASLELGGLRTLATISLVGEGVVLCDLYATPTPFTFGPVTVVSASPSHTFTLGNPCRLSATGRVQARLIGADPAEFVVVRDGCTGTMVAPHGTCTVDVAFAPTRVGPSSATLDFTASPGGNVGSSLTGTGQ